MSFLNQPKLTVLLPHAVIGVLLKNTADTCRTLTELMRVIVSFLACWRDQMAQLGFDNASNNAIARLKQIMRDETTRPTLGLELHRSESQQWYVYESFRPCEMRLSQTEPIRTQAIFRKTTGIGETRRRATCTSAVPVLPLASHCTPLRTRRLR